ncbi:MAG: hypothetical protein R6V53_05015 [Candidatus Woesearchaeota archaeon]
MINHLRRFLTRREPPEVKKACNNLTQDLDILRQWVLHISSRSENMHSHHSSRIDITRREVQNLYSGIEHMYQDVQKLKKALEETGKYILETHKSHKDIYERIATLERTIEGQQRTSQGQQRTQQEPQERTYQGQKRTIQREENTLPITQPRIQIKDRNALNPSQEELMEVLYKATEPLDYKRIAAALGKKEKSVRNMIYEMREKGVDIRDRSIGFRKKGFYLTEEKKIELSGR